MLIDCNRVKENEPLSSPDSISGLPNLSSIDVLNLFRKEIERRYADRKWNPVAPMGFDEILCFELHSQPDNPRSRIGQLGLTFRELADKWNISVTDVGILISDHCKRLSGYETEEIKDDRTI